MDGFDLGSIVAHIKADATEFTAGLEEAKGKADAFSSHLSTIAATGAAVVDALVIGFGVESVKAFAKAQATTAQLNQVLNTTGKVSSITADSVHELAMKLEEYSGQTHEAIEQGQTILLQYDGITNKTLPAASKAMVDLSQRMGVDTVSAAKLLGLALTDPEAGITRLRRSGIVLTEQQKEQIKAMQKAGDTTGAAAKLMGYLETKVGGAGSAYRNTLAGGVAEAKAKLADFEELLGGKIIKTLDEAYQWYQKHARVINDIAQVLGTVIGVIATALFLYGNWILLTKALALAQTLLNAVFIENPIVGILMVLVILAAFIVEHWSNVKQWFRDFINDLKTWFDDVTSDLKQWWKDVSDAVVGSWQAIDDIIHKVLNWFADRIQDVTGYLQKHKKGLEDIAVIITTLLLPAFLKMAAQAAVSAALTVTALVKSFATASASAATSAATTTAAWVVSAAKSTAAFVIGLPKMIAEFAVTAAKAVANAAIVTAAWVVSSAKTLVSWGVSFAGYLAGVAVSVAATLVAAAQMAIAWLVALGPIAIIAAAVIGLAALIILNWKVVKQWFWDFVHDVGGFFHQLVTDIVGYFEWEVKTIIDIWNDVLHWFEKLPGRILKAIGDVGGLLFNVGKDIIQGLINGVENMVGAVGKAITKVADGIKSVAKEVLGIFSPSTVFHDMGMNIGQGLINGMNAMTDMVGAASGSMAIAAVAPASNIVNNAGSSSTINTSITGPINIGSNVDANRFLAQLTYNQELAQKGLTPVR